jgi:hypothetical protein
VDTLRVGLGYGGLFGGGEQQSVASVASLQTARGWARPPCEHFNIQSCCCLGLLRGGGFPNPLVSDPLRALRDPGSSNKFAMALGLFVGVNEHGQSVVLAQCLVAGETTYDYQWQLENLLNATGQVPCVFFTDRDPAMAWAVKETMQQTLHLWYAPNVNRLSQRAGSPVCEPFV